MADSALSQLAQSYGLQTQFWDWKGHPTSIEPSTIIAILAAMGVDASTPQAIDEALAARQMQPWRRPLPACTVTQQGRVARIDAHVPAGEPADVTVWLEEGGQRQAIQVDNWCDDRLIDNQMTGEATFELPADLPLGYHRLVLRSAEQTVAEASLIVTPPQLDMPESVGRRRIWGYAAQLYSVRSAGSWGIGDLADLAALAIWAATQQQASFIQISPLHAAQPEPPMEPSPYLPATRHFVNPIYIRPQTIPEYADVRGPARTRLRSLHKAARRFLDSEYLQRDAVWALKRKALRIVYDAGLGAARHMLFDAYRHSEGRELRDFAVWSVLCAHFGPDWRAWDEPLRRPTSPAVDAFTAEHADDVAFVEWQQWIAQDQLAYAQHAARDAGMRVGIITDLAVGVNPLGADPWILADVYADGVQVGAPPDAYNQLGQTWGQPPLLPDRLAELAYVPFRQTVRAALSNAGGVRIDHVLGLFRLWWVPDGNTPDQGCYVRYDHEAMVGIVALEAQRAGAMIVGEDLGTVEPWVRQYLAQRGVLGTTVLWFECDAHGRALPPQHWRQACLASVTTHDLPPTAGFLALDHVRLRHDLGLLTESLDDELASAKAEQQYWLDYLGEHGYVRETMDGVPIDPVEAVVLGLHRALADSAAQVRAVALVDAVGDRRTQNQPGTIDEYPDWRVPLSDTTGRPMLLEDVFASARPMRLAAVLNDWTHVPPPFSQKEDA